MAKLPGVKVFLFLLIFIAWIIQSCSCQNIWVWSPPLPPSCNAYVINLSVAHSDHMDILLNIVFLRDRSYMLPGQHHGYFFPWAFKIIYSGQHSRLYNTIFLYCSSRLNQSLFITVIRIFARDVLRRFNGHVPPGLKQSVTRQITPRVMDK